MPESVSVAIITGPLHPDTAPWLPEGAGATLSFEGIVRPAENDRPISALRYEAYRPMAENELSRLAQHILARHNLIAVHVEHSEGEVPANQVSFRLRVASRHRKEAILAIDEFIDALKRDVPIWKHPVWAHQEDSR